MIKIKMICSSVDQSSADIIQSSDLHRHNVSSRKLQQTSGGEEGEEGCEEVPADELQEGDEQVETVAGSRWECEWEHGAGQDSVSDRTTGVKITPPAETRPGSWETVLDTWSRVESVQSGSCEEHCGSSHDGFISMIFTTLIIINVIMNTIPRLSPRLWLTLLSRMPATTIDVTFKEWSRNYLLDWHEYDH